MRFYIFSLDRGRVALLYYQPETRVTLGPPGMPVASEWEAIQFLQALGHDVCHADRDQEAWGRLIYYGRQEGQDFRPDEFVGVTAIVRH